MQKYGFCRYCGAQIIWTATLAGKMMPCDPKVIHFNAAGGPETFVTPDGEVKRGRRGETGEVGYISHFATCPEAGKARKRA